MKLITTLLLTISLSAFATSDLFDPALFQSGISNPSIIESSHCEIKLQLFGEATRLNVRNAIVRRMNNKGYVVNDQASGTLSMFIYVQTYSPDGSIGNIPTTGFPSDTRWGPARIDGMDDQSYFGLGNGVMSSIVARRSLRELPDCRKI